MKKILFCIFCILTVFSTSHSMDGYPEYPDDDHWSRVQQKCPFCSRVTGDLKEHWDFYCPMNECLEEPAAAFETNPETDGDFPHEDEVDGPGEHHDDWGWPE